MSRHTPGLARIVNDVYLKVGSVIICDCCPSDGPESDFEQDANTRRLHDLWNALAGVPDPAAFVEAHAALLEACKALVHAINVPDAMCGLIVTEAEDAIAKAEGRTP